MKFLRTLKERRRKAEGGFTLLELITVVGILGLLIAISYSSLSHYQRVGYVTQLKTDVINTAIAASLYVVDNTNANWTTLNQIKAGSDIAGGTYVSQHGMPEVDGQWTLLTAEQIPFPIYVSDRLSTVTTYGTAIDFYVVGYSWNGRNYENGEQMLVWSSVAGGFICNSIEGKDQTC